MFRQFLLNLDWRAGRHLALKLPAYIQEQYLPEGAGVYSCEEWSLARTRGYREAGADSAQLDTDEAYLRRVFSTHVANLHAALRLASTFDFTSRKAVLELGCGEMIQAYILKNIFPHLRYKATDFDSYIIEKCMRLPLLGPLEKGVLDVSALTAGDLAGFDLVLSWELLYALDDTKLRSLFHAAGAARAPLLACTSQLTGPIRFLLRAIKNLNWRPGGFHYERLVRRGALRHHGWNPSLGYYDRLARPCGLRLTRVWTPPYAQTRQEEFSYLLFEPIGP